MAGKTPEKLEEMREFVEDDDRGRTPIFAGRTKEIEAITKDLRRRLTSWRSGGPDPWDSATRLIQGAPGAGKTAILDRLGETLPGEFPGLQVCNLNAKLLGDEKHWKEKLGEALFEGAGERLEATLLVEAGVNAKFVSGGTSVSAPLLTWGAVLRKAKESPAPEAPPPVPKTETKSRAPWPWKGRLKKIKNASDKAGAALSDLGTVRPVLLLIDEIQNAPGDKEGPAAAFLCSMHESVEGLPVFPVYGGLAHSEERLDDLGISRSSDRIRNPNFQTLDPLPEDEARAVCDRFFEYFEISGSERLKERWAEKIASESDGWPKHLHSHLQALGDGLLSAERDLDVLERGGAGAKAEVKRLSRELRERYYGRRLTRKVLKNKRSLAAEAALRVAPGTDDIANLGREIERLAAELGPNDAGAELPPSVTGEQFAEDMVRAGILHKDFAADKIKVPIPSFLDYLREQGFGADEPGPRSGQAPGAGM